MKIANVILMSLAISTLGAVAESRYHAEQAEISVTCSRSTENNFGGVSDTDIAAATAGRESVYSRVPSRATAIKGDRTVTQLAEHFDVHPNQITTWKARLEGAASGVFGSGGMAPTVDVKSLHAKIGELTLKNDFLEGALTKAGLLSARR